MWSRVTPPSCDSSFIRQQVGMTPRMPPPRMERMYRMIYASDRLSYRSIRARPGEMCGVERLPNVAHFAGSSTLSVLVPLGLQKLLGFHRGHAARAGGGHGLLIDAVLDVAGMEHTCHAGARTTLRDDVAFGIELDLAHERFGVGD